MMREAQKMMQDPQFQDYMRQMMAAPQFQTAMKQTQDAMKDPEKVKEMEETIRRGVAIDGHFARPWFGVGRDQGPVRRLILA